MEKIISWVFDPTLIFLRLYIFCKLIGVCISLSVGINRLVLGQESSIAILARQHDVNDNLLFKWIGLDGTLVGIEAAHIHWKTYGGPCVVNNGLALCSLHHDAFDMGAFGLDENLTIRISGGVSRSPVVDNLFWQRNGQQLHLPHDKSLWPTEQYVGWHRKQIFKA